MLFGWRMWRVCVVLAFGVIGAVVTARLLGSGPDQQFYVICGGIGLGLASYFPVRHSVVVLGGVLVMGIVYYLLSDHHLEVPILYAAMGLAMFAGIAYSALNRQKVVVFVTSFIGAVLLMSGLIACLGTFPGLFGTIQSIAARNSLVIPFLILVPSVMSAFYQIAEIHRLQVDPQPSVGWQPSRPC